MSQGDQRELRLREAGQREHFAKIHCFPIDFSLSLRPTSNVRNNPSVLRISLCLRTNFYSRPSKTRVSFSKSLPRSRGFSFSGAMVNPTSARQQISGAAWSVCCALQARSASGSIFAIVCARSNSLLQARTSNHNSCCIRSFAKFFRKRTPRACAFAPRL